MKNSPKASEVIPLQHRYLLPTFYPSALLQMFTIVQHCTRTQDRTLANIIDSLRWIQSQAQSSASKVLHNENLDK